MRSPVLQNSRALKLVVFLWEVLTRNPRALRFLDAYERRRKLRFDPYVFDDHMRYHELRKQLRLSIPPASAITCGDQAKGSD
jgi:hypothetical protein